MIHFIESLNWTSIAAILTVVGIVVGWIFGIFKMVFANFKKMEIQPLALSLQEHRNESKKDRDEVKQTVAAINESIIKVVTKMDMHAEASKEFRKEIINKVDNLDSNITKLSEEQVALERRIENIESRIK
jgi:uncharacterized membrane-anchored protein YhcB (DUF1043 family)